MNQPLFSHRVLVFGDDTRSFLSVVRSLGRRGIEIHAVPFKKYAPALSSRYITKCHHLPAYDGSDRWITALMQLISEFKFDVLMPCCDRSIRCLDAHRTELAGIHMALPSRQVLECLFDKHETRKQAKSAGVPVPRGRLLTDGDTVDSLVQDYGLPLLIKARRSYVLENLEHRGEVTIVRHSAQLGKVLASLDDRDEFLVEEYFAGTGAGVSVLASEGRILCVFQHGRLKEPRAGGGSSLRQSELIDPVLLSSCRKIARDTNLTGVAMFEFRIDRNSGQWVLLEVNARFWGSLPLPLALGVDFPYYQYQLLIYGREVSQPEYAAGIRARNFAINAYDVLLRDMRNGYFSLKMLAADLLDLATHPIAMLLGNEKSDTFQLDDLRPAFAELFFLPMKVIYHLILLRLSAPRRSFGKNLIGQKHDA
ncbi:MAG: hypothetical protein HKN11_16960 [Rhizobiales bacterium]|nr:hypothetical protein [Hyphomicrobiales bacterium]